MGYGLYIVRITFVIRSYTFNVLFLPFPIPPNINTFTGFFTLFVHFGYFGFHPFVPPAVFAVPEKKCIQNALDSPLFGSRFCLTNVVSDLPWYAFFAGIRPIQQQRVDAVFKGSQIARITGIVAKMAYVILHKASHGYVKSMRGIDR
jgi:hypothetical protein